MAFTIEITSFPQTGSEQFAATGTLDGTSFVASTILYRGEPIFKVQEADENGEVGLQRMADSKFARGQRIALAARLKAIRIGKVVAPAPKDLNDLTVKELRSKAKSAGLRGYHAKDVRKADLVALLAA